MGTHESSSDRVGGSGFSLLVYLLKLERQQRRCISLAQVASVEGGRRGSVLEDGMHVSVCPLAERAGTEPDASSA